MRQWQWQCEKDNTTKVTSIASNRKAKPDAKPSKIYRWWVRDDGDHYVWTCARLCVCVCVCAWSMRVCVAYAQLGGLQYVGSISVSALHCLPSVDFVPPITLSLSLLFQNKLQPQLRKWPTGLPPYKSRPVRTCKWARQKEKETEAGQQN